MPVNKKIVIFSPQRWSHLYVSKHHYAMELAKNNEVWFISAPAEKKQNGVAVTGVDGFPNLKLVEYSVALPQIFKFKLRRLYKKYTERKLRAIVKTLVGDVDWVIDFGCYQFINSLSFINAKHKVYFPVDDFGDLKLTDRGAQKIFSVSTSIINKFRNAGLDCMFINHGLSEEFTKEARPGATSEGKLKFAYSGNLFLRFLDIPVLQKIVADNPAIEFHFFGSANFDAGNKLHADWHKFLTTASNVKLHGFLSAEKLAKAYRDMDGFLLCYKPDYKDYHAENSHKVFEYLSTGKVLVTTYLSIYEDNRLLNMSGKDKNEELVDVFADAVAHIRDYNSAELQKKRINMALDNTYSKQLERIEAAFENGR